MKCSIPPSGWCCSTFAVRCLGTSDVDGDLNSCVIGEGIDDGGVMLASLNSFAG